MGWLSSCRASGAERAQIITAQYAAIHRAGELFRTDVRAGDVDLAAGQGSASRIVVTLPDQGTIEYTAGEARIDRQVRESGQIALRDTFASPLARPRRGCATRANCRWSVC